MLLLGLACQTAFVFHGTFRSNWKDPGLLRKDCCLWLGLRRDTCTWPKVPSELVKPRWLVAHRGGLLLGLSCQFGSQYRSSLYLLGHFVRFLFVPLSLPPRISPPGSSSSISPLGSSIVVHHLYPRVSADLEYFSTLHGAGVDEHDFAR